MAQTEVSKLRHPLMKGLLMVGMAILYFVTLASFSVVWGQGGGFWVLATLFMAGLLLYFVKRYMRKPKGWMPNASIFGVLLLSTSIVSVILSASPTDRAPQQESTPIDVEIVANEDQSHKATGAKPLSSFTGNELQALPVVKKMAYHIVVTSPITTEQIRPTVEKIVTEIRKSNPDIDEITLWLYSDKALTQEPYDIAMATWGVNGKLGQVTPEIARNNDRSGYDYTIDIKPDLEAYLAQRKKAENKLGLSENTRREIWHALIQAEDRASKEADARYPSDQITTQEKMEARVKLENTLLERYKAKVLKKYHLTEAQNQAITSEGSEENWPEQ